ncbi:gasdermin-A isoform X2 [Elgaria multicarinata webbii]|uniref:gasdermin-A isoform X2 n=1 Tax=Elgaria multicarinata webbii TaxID=159646 RepID=UPI002FCD278C
MSFCKATKSLAKQLDPKGDLIPVDSIINQNHFRPLCLVQRKTKSSWWQNCPFHKTGYELGDVLSLEDHAAKLEVKDSDPIIIVDQVDGTVEGDFGGRVDATAVEVKGTASLSHARSVKVKKIHVSSRVLDSLTSKGNINMDHEFIKQSKKLQRNLYVISEAVEVVEETQFDESSKAEGSIFYEAWIKMKLKGARDTRKAIVIPKACILAFAVKQLRIQDNTASLYYYPNKKTRTFEQPGFQSDAASSLPSRSLVGCKDLVEEVKWEYATFTLLSANLCCKFLTGFVAIMTENDLLLKLELQLEEAIANNDQSKLKAFKPELQGLVENLCDASGAINTDLAEAVLYFLQALSELMEDQLIILAESVGKKIVSQQLALVESILKNDFSCTEKKFAVHAQHLTEEDLNITGAMIEMSGVTMGKNGPHLLGTGKPAAFTALSALYVALYGFNLLST